MTPFKRYLARMLGIRLFPPSGIKPMHDTDLVGRCARTAIAGATLGDQSGEWADAPTPRQDVRNLLATIRSPTQ